MSNFDQTSELHWAILRCMTRPGSSDRDSGNGAGIWTLRAGDPIQEIVTQIDRVTRVELTERLCL
jgi:hypothetical protein